MARILILGCIDLGNRLDLCKGPRHGARLFLVDVIKWYASRYVRLVGNRRARRRQPSDEFKGSRVDQLNIYELRACDVPNTRVILVRHYRLLYGAARTDRQGQRRFVPYM